MHQRNRWLILLIAALISAGQAVPTSALTPHISPLAPECPKVRSSQGQAAINRLKAHISRAAICTQDVSQIKFQEYYVDWSGWMTELANRWAFIFNEEMLISKFQPCGQALIEFTCYSDGTIGDIWVERSSGDAACDREQINALKACMPLPAFPAGSRKQEVTMLYVWDYASKSRLVKQVRPRPESPTIEKISASGKTM